MKYVIHKYQLELRVGRQVVQLPERARPMSVAFQGPSLVLWAVHEAPARGGLLSCPREIGLAWTGTEFESYYLGGVSNFLGTCADPTNGLVWHVFDLGVL